MDQYGDVTNGTTATAMQLARILREHGHTVRVVTCIEGVNEDNVYLVPKREFPLVMKIIRSQGMEFAYPDKGVLTSAIRGADIVHFFLPFKLAKVGKMISDKYHIASSAAFHLQPENITYSVKLNKLKLVHTAIYKGFELFYDKFTHIHCPSQMVADILSGYNYRPTKHVISNGVADWYEKTQSDRPEELKDKYLIMMSGRFSREKRQDLIIKAVAGSKYRDKIKLIFCGKGPWQEYLVGLSQKLLPADNQPIFKFCDKQELRDTINYCDLYIHASDAEIEAISCMEAFTCGLVPVISDSPTTATGQFALCERNLFRAGDEKDLRAKIEYFIENPEEKQKLSEQYLEYAKQYRVENCVSEMEKMFEQVIAENREKWGGKVGLSDEEYEAGKTQV